MFLRASISECDRHKALVQLLLDANADSVITYAADQTWSLEDDGFGSEDETLKWIQLGFKAAKLDRPIWLVHRVTDDEDVSDTWYFIGTEDEVTAKLEALVAANPATDEDEDEDPEEDEESP